MKQWVKVTLSIIGAALGATTTYLGAHQDTWNYIGLLVAVGTPISTYLIGLVQSGPGQGGK